MLSTLRTTWQSAGWIRYLILIPMSLALWNAPLPWLHHHDMSEARTDGSLARHLRMFHHGTDAQDGRTWHWHFAFLWQLIDCDQAPGRKQHSHSVLMTGDDCPYPSASEVSPRELVERFLTQGIALVELPGGDPVQTLPLDSTGGSRHFLQTFLTGASLRELLGVARC